MKLTKSTGHSAGLRTRLFAALPADDGLTLVEVVVAMLILVVGLLSLAQVFYMGVKAIAGSSQSVIAREKAREAIESVHSARDTRIITWNQIRNAAPPDSCPEDLNAVGGGIFDNGAVHLGGPGPDGLVNTDDDTDAEIAPGKDHIVGTSDDVRLEGFTREINICDVPSNANLRMITVVIRYTSGSARQQEYRLTSYVSKFS
jgi:type II secretory pathway pseudopilin PulG